MNRFADRWVLITGASSGIGLAATQQFLNSGANVIAVARREAPLQALVDSLDADTQKRVVPLTADVSDPESMNALIKRLTSMSIHPEIIVANAGIGIDALFENTDESMWESSFQTNVMGVVRTIKPFLPHMKQRQFGRIIMVSSVVGIRGVPFYSAYSASKFALHGLAQALRVELAKTGVTVSLVCPSSTDTNFHTNKKTKGPRQSDRRVQKHSADSVANVILEVARSGSKLKVLSLEGKTMHWLQRLAPSILDRILYRVLMRDSDRS